MLPLEGHTRAASMIVVLHRQSMRASQGQLHRMDVTSGLIVPFIQHTISVHIHADTIVRDG